MRRLQPPRRTLDDWRHGGWRRNEFRAWRRSEATPEPDGTWMVRLARRRPRRFRDLDKLGGFVRQLERIGYRVTVLEAVGREAIVERVRQAVAEDGALTSLNIYATRPIHEGESWLTINLHTNERGRWAEAVSIGQRDTHDTSWQWIGTLANYTRPAWRPGMAVVPAATVADRAESRRRWLDRGIGFGTSAVCLALLEVFTPGGVSAIWQGMGLG